MDVDLMTKLLVMPMAELNSFQPYTYGQAMLKDAIHGRNIDKVFKLAELILKLRECQDSLKSKPKAKAKPGPKPKPQSDLKSK